MSKLYWQGGAAKRGPPTPVGSGITTPAETPKPAQETMEVDTEGEQKADLLQPFSFQSDAAIEVTAGALGVDINDQNAITGWLEQLVTNNRQVFDMVRAYHEKVIRPEYYSLTCQLEQGLKQVNEGVLHVRRELAWMASENRTAQRHACGTQLLTVGWPTGMPPQG